MAWESNLQPSAYDACQTTITPPRRCIKTEFKDFIDIRSIAFLQEWTVRSVRKVGTEQTVQWSVLTLITTLVQTRATRTVLPTGPVRTVTGN